MMMSAMGGGGRGEAAGVAKETAFGHHKPPLPENHFWILLSLGTCRAWPATADGPGPRAGARGVRLRITATLMLGKPS